MHPCKRFDCFSFNFNSLFLAQAVVSTNNSFFWDFIGCFDERRSLHNHSLSYSSDHSCFILIFTLLLSQLIIFLFFSLCLEARRRAALNGLTVRHKRADPARPEPSDSSCSCQHNTRTRCPARHHRRQAQTRRSCWSRSSSSCSCQLQASPRCPARHHRRRHKRDDPIGCLLYTSDAADE